MKKIGKIIYAIFLVFIIGIAALLVLSVFPITGSLKFLIVQSGSMEPQIKTGSIVIVKPATDYKVGDIITFAPAAKKNMPITHRIAEIRNVNGENVYITKGDANNASDSTETKKREIIGKVFLAIPYVGYAVDFAKKPMGFALIIIVPAGIIIADEVKKIIYEFKRIKNEKSKASQG